MIDLLHDEIDQTEVLVSRAKERTEQTIKSTLMGHLNADEGQGIVEVFKNALLSVAEDVGNAQADLTTEAVQIGAENARKRYEFTK